MNAIISTRQDLDSLAITDPTAHAEFITQLRASLTTRMDVRAYPEDYDRTLLPEAPGYIAPVYEVHDTPEIAARFGLAPEELILASYALGTVDPDEAMEPLLPSS